MGYVFIKWSFGKHAVKSSVSGLIYRTSSQRKVKGAKRTYLDTIDRRNNQ
jgi:hypothetical protein